MHTEPLKSLGRREKRSENKAFLAGEESKEFNKKQGKEGQGVYVEKVYVLFLSPTKR